MKAIRNKWLWTQRVIEYGFRYFVLEKPRGLDFSKRSRDRRSTATSSGYALTSKRALKNVLSYTEIVNDSKFIDVGGGKGGASYYALKLGFKRSTSLELESYLHDIALRNVKILGVENQLELVNQDAFQFPDYQNYSHLYLFKPISGPLMKDLLDHIYQCIEESPKFDDYYFLLYGQIEFEHIDNSLLGNSNSALIVDTTCPYRRRPLRVVRIQF